MHLSSRPEFDQATRPGEMLSHYAQNKILEHVRNHLTPEQTAMIDREALKIAKELKFWLPDSERITIQHMKREAMPVLHSSLGRSIRNEFELWNPEHHVTKIWSDAQRDVPLATSTTPTTYSLEVEGRTVDICSTSQIDTHPCHPDNFSGLCLQKLWEILQ